MANDLSNLKDITAESAVISSLIIHPEYYLVDNELKPRYFTDAFNQCMFWAIEQLVTSGVDTIDVINLENVLSSNKAVKEAIQKYNSKNIQEFIDMAQYAARSSYQEYKLLVETIKTLAYKRDLIVFSNDIRKQCINPKMSVDELSEFVTVGIDDIGRKFIFGSDSVLFGDKIDAIWKNIEDSRNDDGSFGVASIIPSLSNYFTYGKGELALLAGATGKGKSSLFLNEATNALKKGIPTMIIDTELTDEVFLPRLIANLSGVRVRDIKSGKMTEAEIKRVMECIEWVKKQPFVHEYMPFFNKVKVEQIVRKWKIQHDLEFLIYDYIKPGTTYGAAETSQSLGLMTDFLKSMAGDLKISVIAGLQLNKLTGSVADSQKPERYADVLMYWKEKTADEIRQDGLDCGNYKIQIIKNRNGAITDEDDYIDISFKGDYMSIKEAENHHKNDETPFGGTTNDVEELSNKSPA